MGLTDLFKSKKNRIDPIFEIMETAEKGDLQKTILLVRDHPDKGIDALTTVSSAKGVACLLQCPEIAAYAGNDKDNREALRSAIFTGNTEAVRALLEISRSIPRSPDDTRHDRDVIKTGYLEEIIWKGQTEKLDIAKLLIQHGANLKEATKTIDIINAREQTVIDQRKACLAAASVGEPEAPDLKTNRPAAPSPP